MRDSLSSGKFAHNITIFRDITLPEIAPYRKRRGTRKGEWTMLEGYGELIAAFAVFLLLHSIPPMHNVKGRLIALCGRPVYYGLYSIVSLLAVVWLIHAVWAAPYLELWPFVPWEARLTAHVMPFAAVLFVAGFVRPNPLSIGYATGYDPQRPGIVGIVRHPVLWGFALWSGAHLFPNGDLAAVIFFGGCLLLALLGMVIVDRRKQRLMGVTRWQKLAQGTSNIPFLGFSRGGSLRLTPRDGVGILLGLALFALLLALHPYLFNAYPLSGFVE